MRFKTIIFDLDGTLLNTLGDLTDAVNHSLAKRGYAARTENEVRSFVGNGVRKLVARALPAGKHLQTEACLEDFRAYYASHMTERTVPYSGIPALLAALCARGITLAVLSNKLDSASKMLVEHYFAGIFALTLGERPAVPRKPDPAAALEILHTLGADAAQTLYVGDSDVDMQTAKNAGLFAAGVTWGFRSREVLAEHGADLLVDHPEQILQLVEE